MATVNKPVGVTEKHVRIEIDTDATVTVVPVGFKGAACRKATEGIERALGGKLLQRVATADANVADNTVKN